ncbi:PEP-utilizing enzyme [Mycobacterium talmoniae]|uniref:Phosphoenolpyruvate carboxykinase n=1 Tax=Mycobacterium talmoniae TaxID=1858794 RepID=A0A1S1NL17_9MYCO|nr:MULTISPECIES: PEP-utilizing enzyme [Mycobacterium]OHV05234.1 phosphoenolpyruvate carboxykinase [Mycobacterium talmoniae]PQM45371.1 Prodigiosin synthesizing transferase PigC [Mycobacterium talmoniae]TDH48334.1 phosphoenolpyruvate carboxykinase [Mycobacterium eburneum]
MNPSENFVDPVDHTNCDPAVAWTSGNVAEAFPGVCTPLGFSFMHAPVELALRGAFRDIGVLTDAQLVVPELVEEQFWSVFAGRAAANMDQFRALADLTPGTSATAVENQLFGYVRAGIVDNNSYRRYPVIAVRAPLLIARLSRAHDAYFAEVRQWWQTVVRRVATAGQAECLDMLEVTQERFGHMMRLHFLATFVGNGLADRLAALVAQHGELGLEAKLLSGVGSEEADVAEDLWELAHGGLDLQVFVDRHGYHGPQEGQIDSVSWRESPQLLASRLAEYRAMGRDSARAPQQRARQRRQEREAAERLVRERLRWTSRVQLRPLVKAASRFLALREQGKAGYLMMFDAARACARRLGDLKQADGLLDRADDVFFVTYSELKAGPPPAGRAHISERRARHELRQNQRLPESWVGVPEPIPLGGPTGSGAEAGTVITGVGACNGVVEGRARVITDPDEIDLDEGDILVCEATDPSWISLFMVASGVVTDLGGMLSHGAIVAREMGIPAVVGTRTGSRTIADGQRVRLDGDNGTVEVLGGVE